MCKHISAQKNPEIYQILFRNVEPYVKKEIDEDNGMELKYHEHWFLQKMKIYMEKMLKTHERSHKEVDNIFNMILEENEFWGGEFNPYLTQFYQLLLNHFIECDQNS